MTEYVVTDPVYVAAEETKWRKFTTLLRQAEKSMAQQRYAHAETLLRRSLQIDPHAQESLLMLAEIYDSQGKLPQALEAYRQIMNNPWGGSIASDPTTAMRFVLTLLRANETQEAARVFNKAMDDTALPYTPDPVKDRAWASHDNSLLAPYIQKYALLTLRFDPQNPDIGQIQAAAHLVLGTTQPSHLSVPWERLTPHLMTAIRLRPHWGKSHFALGQALERERRYPEAQAAYARAVELEDPEALAKQKREEAQRQQQARNHQEWEALARLNQSRLPSRKPTAEEQQELNRILAQHDKKYFQEHPLEQPGYPLR